MKQSGYLDVYASLSEVSCPSITSTFYFFRKIGNSMETQFVITISCL